MNKDRIERLADFIEKSETEIQMRREFEPPFLEQDPRSHPIECYTAACIAGFACAMGQANGELVIQSNDNHYMGIAAGYLGIDPDGEFDNVRDLFMPSLPRYRWSSGPEALGYITKKMAVKTLRHLAQTGDIDWEAANG